MITLLIDTYTNFITIYPDDQCLVPKKLAECSASKTSESSLQGNNNLKSTIKATFESKNCTRRAGDSHQTILSPPSHPAQGI